MPAQLERIFKIFGAYDGRTHPRNYGISPMRMWVAVKGPAGGISASLSTSWYLPQNQESSFQLYTRGYPFDHREELMQPKWTDISEHYKVPSYKEQSKTTDCQLTDGDCYCDGTSLWGQEAWLLGFLHGGSDWLFTKLEEHYRHVFEDGPAVDLTPVPHNFDK